MRPVRQQAATARWRAPSATALRRRRLSVGPLMTAQARDRSTARSHVAWAASAVARSASGSNVASSCQRAAIACEVGPHALGQPGEVGRAERGGLLVDRPPHGDAELVGLELQQTSIADAPPSTRSSRIGVPLAPHHRVDDVAGLVRHRLDDGPGEVGRGRAAGDADDRAPGVRIPPRRARAR